MKVDETKAPGETGSCVGCSESIFAEVRGLIDQNRGHSGAVIRVLQQVQGKIGYLPTEVLTAISEGMKIPLSEVNGIISFYHFFTTVPRGKHVVQVCLGTACYVRGGQRLLDVLKKDYRLQPGETTSDGMFSLDTVRCLGACALAPVATVDGQVFRRMKPTGVKELLSHYG
ncbi:MAG: NAD(P)H-dependent oxidoreductase subunit E [Chloroflexi bacterium]|nr:NAD(P)H-dependent oxidoreductase subunit E [Chloroflexota bacterium]